MTELSYQKVLIILLTESNTKAWLLLSTTIRFPKNSKPRCNIFSICYGHADPLTSLKDILRPVQYHCIFTGMENSTAQSQTWPDLAIGLYDKLTGRGAEITYELHNLELSIPSSTSPQAQHALWKLNGTVKIRTRDDKTTPRA